MRALAVCKKSLYFYLFTHFFRISLPGEKVRIKVQSCRLSANLPLLPVKGLQIQILRVPQRPLGDWKMRHRRHETVICGSDYKYDAWCTEEHCIFTSPISFVATLPSVIFTILRLSFALLHRNFLFPESGPSVSCCLLTTMSHCTKWHFELGHRQSASIWERNKVSNKAFFATT